MKQTKTFRLEADTIDYLKQQPNASAYVEELIEKDRGAAVRDQYSNKALFNELLKIKSTLLNIENSGVGGTSSEIPSKENNWGCICAHNPWGERTETQLGCPEHDGPQHSIEDTINA